MNKQFIKLIIKSGNKNIAQEEMDKLIVDFFALLLEIKLSRKE